MDRADIHLLEALQRDSTQSIAELAESAALSTSACHRRIRALEQSGIISGYGARLDPKRLGLSLVVFVEITLTSQSHEAMDRFEKAVRDFDDILDCNLMSGNADYLLRVAAADLEQFDTIHRECLARLPGVSSMRSSFSIRNIKQWRGYPIARG
ncbi:winged helix-turn-helix transcriptional regulator [Porphyrobacter algicida]|uniref:Winged helix-turn-helix transcriptional regulator n=1 Tax=Qipengyuania algicida TaxID=1836209 RepID=A0A845AI30_9SPHN|nr:Lrp/AsnC family transcriptional regulator [Qipengyuania algicida]MXP28206.1 winged helix-turn-helix transcriptional regulator [Qipengyuania algicida]